VSAAAAAAVASWVLAAFLLILQGVE